MLVVQDHGLGVNEMMLHQSITNNTATHKQISSSQLLQCITPGLLHDESRDPRRHHQYRPKHLD